MTAESTPTADEVRAEVRGWLATYWDPDRPLREWRELLVDSGWGCPTWPADLWGRGLPAALGRVVGDALAAAGAVGVAVGAGMALAAPTLLEHGPSELARRLLRPLATGEHTWCQLFSEPGSGSDLAGLTTRADRDGSGPDAGWVVNGQKLWTTGAHHAAYGMLLARTDWDVPKHAGITYFALPMDQPGVEVRSVRQMNGHASFNEVFLTDAWVPPGHVVGEPGHGWAAARTTLAHERGLATGRLAPSVPSEGETGRTVREAAAEAAEYARTYVWYPQRAGRPDLAIPHARTAGRVGDPLVRQALAALHAAHVTARWNLERARAARAAGRPPGPEGSIAKLASSHIARAGAAVHGALSGAHGMLSGPESPYGGTIAEVLVSVPAQSIAGGTDEIQRNILGERILGLPREPAADAELPFREVRTNRPR